MIRISAILAIVSVAVVLLPATAASCPSCFGATDSPLKEGMDMAILAMLGITGMVLGGIGAFFIAMRRRIKKFSEVASGNAHVNRKGVLEWKNT